MQSEMALLGFNLFVQPGFDQRLPGNPPHPAAKSSLVKRASGSGAVESGPVKGMGGALRTEGDLDRGGPGVPETG